MVSELSPQMWITPMKSVGNFLSNRNGNVAMIFGLLALPTFAVTGAAIDFGLAQSAFKQLQSLADETAIAGGRLPATTDEIRLAAATDIYKTNVSQLSFSGVTKTISASNSTVSVTASYNYPTSILKLIGLDEIPLQVRAAARPQIENGGVACILALNESLPDSFHLQGINEANSKNCWVWVNSSSSSAMSAVGASVASAKGFCMHGGVDGAEHFGPRPFKCNRLDDPFHKQMWDYSPLTTKCDHNNKTLKKGSYTLKPGVYCGSTSLKPHADVTLEKGVYIIKDGDLDVQAGATLNGEAGVTIFFMGSNTFFNVQGGANVLLKAPAEGEGEFPGFVLVDRKPSSYSPIYETIIRGGGSLKIEGVVYAPQWRIIISGNSEMNQDSKCFAMVADRFHMEGNGKLNVVADCEASGLPQIMPKIKSGPLLVE